MKGCLIALAMATLTCPRISGQGLEVIFSGTAAGIRPLQPDVVKMTADDPGAPFDGIEGGAQFQLSHPVTKWLAWRTDVGYTYGHHRFELPCKCVMPFDRTTVIQNDLRIHGVVGRAGVEFRTPQSQYWFMNLELGFEAVAHARRDAEYVMRFAWQRPDSTVALVTDEPYALRSGLGAFVPQLEMSVGRQFGEWHPVRLELFMRQDLGDRAYGLLNLQGISQEVRLRRTSIGVRFGVRLGQRNP